MYEASIAHTNANRHVVNHFVCDAPSVVLAFGMSLSQIRTMPSENSERAGAEGFLIAPARQRKPDAANQNRNALEVGLFRWNVTQVRTSLNQLAVRALDTVVQTLDHRRGFLFAECLLQPVADRLYSRVVLE